jgi:phage gp37-like protein
MMVNVKPAQLENRLISKYHFHQVALLYKFRPLESTHNESLIMGLNNSENPKPSGMQKARNLWGRLGVYK